MQHDAMPLDSCLALWGVEASVEPMAPPAAQPNGKAEIDPTRTPWAGKVIRAEYAARLTIGDNGMGRASGQFRGSAAGSVHIVTFKTAEGFEPRQGDHLTYADRPGQRFILRDPRPDGGAGIHFSVNKV